MAIALRRVAFSSFSFWMLIFVSGILYLATRQKMVNFGIDLVGGTYITLQVHTDKAVESEIAERIRGISTALTRENKDAPASQEIVKNTARLFFNSEGAAGAAESYIASRDSRLSVSRVGKEVTFSLPAEEVSRIEREAVQGNINVLRARLDGMGVGEIAIAAAGERSIVVELPDVHNPQQAKAMIGTPAILEIKRVEDSGASREEIEARYHGRVPRDMEIIPGRSLDHPEYFLVCKYTDLTGRLLRDSRADTGGRLGFEPVVKFSFKPEGGEKFYALTSRNIGRRVAIILDGAVLTAPTVNSAINADGEITGNFTMESARELASLLRSGAFVAPVTFEEERHIGPSLGRESVHSGLIACLVGLGLLFLFSVVVYKTAGLFAFFVLLYNIFIILFVLSQLGATLTLPGIAGMILTVGMAIDASILIYERIREELIHNVPFARAVEVGFSGALAVILDANITHLLVALVLYNLGAGPIQGFAVTMIIGILSTLVSGLLVLRSMFTFTNSVLGINKISI